MIRDVVASVLSVYLLCMQVVFLLYIVRHYTITLNRMFNRQKNDYKGIIDDDYLSVTVMVPMHNEERVIHGVLDALIRCDYPRGKMEVIGVNDHSTDRTREILDKYAAFSREKPGEWPTITAFHRDEGLRGKQNALNDAMKMAKGDIILVFDADYLPPRDIIRSLTNCFKDPSVGAVMGRVIPLNTKTNLLTRLEDLERTGGYQIDQQAKYNLGLLPQYGGTVGGFRKKVVMELGGFHPNVLAEDTELTFRLAINGWRTVYANTAECYEESPETWKGRANQIRRWSRGHNQTLLTTLVPFLKSPKLTLRQKFDGTLVLFAYMLPLFWWFSWVAMFLLWFIGGTDFLSTFVPLTVILVYGCLGNFAPFFQLGFGCLLDGSTNRIRLLPYFFYYFPFSLWYTSLGAVDAVIDVVTKRKANWKKTERARSDGDAGLLRDVHLETNSSITGGKYSYSNS